ncbi:MAG: hypothetical protein ACRCTY_06735, partial [Candidatus Adiutrix sp.]
KVSEARQYFERAGGDNRQAVLGLARASELLNDNPRAATLYERAVTMERDPYPEALELAGRFFGKNGQRAKGHYYLAQYFAAVGNIDQAIFHYGEVIKEPGGTNYKNIASREIKILQSMKNTK